MSADSARVEALLRQALAPVEPPEHFAERLETTFAGLAELAADELESWELSAMRDPRNWARPAAAVVVGTTAGAALMVLRARQRHRRKAASENVLDMAERAMRGVAKELRNLR
jgi:hypothetical protein